MPLPFLASELAFTGEIAGALEGLPGVCASVAEGLRRRKGVAAAAQVEGVQTLVGASAVSDAAPGWRQIESAGGAASPFQSLALAQATADVHLARGEVPHIVVVRERGRPVVILPTVLGRWGGLRTLRFLGDPMIQYGDVLAAPDARPHHLDAAWRALVTSAPASLVYLRKVRADARIAPLLAERASPVAVDGAPFVDIHREFPRHARDQRELRRFHRRLSEHGEVRFELRRGREALALVQQAIGLKRQWLQQRGLASQVIGDTGWETVLSELAASSRGSCLAVTGLTVGGRLAAAEVGLVQGGRWYAFLGATRAEFAKAGPGHVLMAETIACCRADGLTVYDLLAPAQAYKRAMASGAVAVHDYAAALNAAGRLALWAASRVPAAKGALAALPAPVRRLLLRLALRAAPADAKE